MLLGVISMIGFEFLRILEKIRKKRKPENLGKHGPLRCSIGHPHRSEVEGPKRPPPPPGVRYDVALLHRGVGIVH